MEQIKTKKYKLTNSKLVSAGEGTAIRDDNGVLYRNMEDLKRGITAKMRCEGYTEPQTKQAEQQKAETPEPTPPPKENNTADNTSPFSRFTTITFGDDFTDQMKKATGWNVVGIITDNRTKTDDELRDKPTRPSPLTEPVERVYSSQKEAKKYIGHRLTVDYIERLANGVQRIWIKPKKGDKNQTPPINYIGTIEFKDVKHISLTEKAIDRWVYGKYNTAFTNEDFLHINGKNIGTWEYYDDRVFAGCYTIKLDGDTASIASKHNNMFDCLEKDLRGAKNTNINLRNAVKKCGVVGAEIHISKAQPKEKDAKELKRETVRVLRDSNITLYNNKPTKDVEEVTVDTFSCVSGFSWRIGETDEWNSKDTDKLIYDMWLTYIENGGKENGMYYKIY